MNVGHYLAVRIETAAALAAPTADDAAAIRAAIRSELQDLAAELRRGDWIELPGAIVARVEFKPEGGDA